MLLQTAVQQKWKVWKADVKAAFLQGKEFDPNEQRHALPPPELAEALVMHKSDIRPVKLMKAVYGLTRAPLDWYTRVAFFIARKRNASRTEGLNAVVILSLIHI